MKKKLLSFLIAVAITCNILSAVTLHSFAHSAMLDVVYDECVASKLSDSMYETWYSLSEGSICYHLSHQTTIVKYYFEDSANGQSWTNIPDAEEIKNAYVNSMKKWNNVYFYSNDSSGNIIKNKIINIIEGTAEDHNLSIFPGVTNLGNIAETGSVYGVGAEPGTTSHFHNAEWRMGINISYFSVSGGYSADIVNWVREAVGAHELAHVLGLKDVDECCSQSDEENHHLEILMGYGLPLTDRVQDITYKDIAGVAITRGFHTDDDHKWLNCGQQSDGKYKLVCSICNGVKNVDSLNGYLYNTYNYCGGNHALSGGNMMAVASYGTKDYYKCKYCRYVAPFSSSVEQNYSKINYSHTYHKCVNNVAGLEYTFYEEHNIVDNECLGCGELIHSYTDHYDPYSTTQHKAYCNCGEYKLQQHVIYNDVCNLCGTAHTHDYTKWEYYSGTHHIEKCICGEIGTIKKVHVVSSRTPGRYKQCILCGGTIDTFSDVSQIESAVSMVTENGSYILPSGVIVLVDEDIEAYLNGELVFYNKNENSETI